MSILPSVTLFLTYIFIHLPIRRFFARKRKRAREKAFRKGKRLSLLQTVLETLNNEFDGDFLPFSAVPWIQSVVETLAIIETEGTTDSLLLRFDYCIFWWDSHSISTSSVLGNPSFFCFRTGISIFNRAVWWSFQLEDWWFRALEMDDSGESFVAVRRLSQGLERSSGYHSTSGMSWISKFLNFFFVVLRPFSYPHFLELL